MELYLANMGFGLLHILHIYATAQAGRILCDGIGSSEMTVSGHNATCTVWYPSGMSISTKAYCNSTELLPGSPYLVVGGARVKAVPSNSCQPKSEGEECEQITIRVSALNESFSTEISVLCTCLFASWTGHPHQCSSTTAKIILAPSEVTQDVHVDVPTASSVSSTSDVFTLVLSTTSTLHSTPTPTQTSMPSGATVELGSKLSLAVIVISGAMATLMGLSP